MAMGNIDWTHLLFGFSGRINRAKFWLAILVFFIANIIVAILQWMLGSLGDILAVIVGIAIFISGIAVALKRLYDRDRPWWWLLIFYIAPVVLIGIGTIFGVVAVATDASTGGGILASLFFVAGGAIAIWAFVELGCLRGTIGPNQYGPDPLGGL
jgi:uncharacterized membrane protein YhaH (DUF805 family)